MDNQSLAENELVGLHYLLEVIKSYLVARCRRFSHHLMDLLVRHALLQLASDICKALYRDFISALVSEQIEDISEALLGLRVVDVVHEGLVKLLEIDHDEVLQVISVRSSSGPALGLADQLLADAHDDWVRLLEAEFGCCALHRNHVYLSECILIFLEYPENRAQLLRLLLVYDRLDYARTLQVLSACELV